MTTGTIEVVRQLAGFFRSVHRLQELQNFLVEYGYNDIVDAVAARQPLSSYTMAVARELLRRGYLNEVFFAHLSKNWPQRRFEARRLKELILASLRGEDASEAPTAPPVTRSEADEEEVAENVTSKRFAAAAIESPPPRRKPSPARPRVVNVWLTARQRRTPLPTRKQLLWRCWYRLWLDVGPQRAHTSVLRPATIAEHIERRIRELEGDMLDVAIDSPHFAFFNERVTSPVPADERRTAQPTFERGEGEWNSYVDRLWLPAHGPSDPLIVNVAPQRLGLCYLRISLFHSGQLVQALRLDARVRPSNRPALELLPLLGHKRRERLVAAGIIDLGWLARADSRQVARIARVSDRLARAWIHAARTRLDYRLGDIAELPGLSQTQLTSLRQGGIGELASLAMQPPGIVADHTGASPRRAVGFIASARQLQALGHETVVEYTASSDLSQLSDLPQRTVTIVANRVHNNDAVGVHIVKGGFHKIRTIEALHFENILTAAREVLHDIGTGRDGTAYGFRQGVAELDKRNRGEPDKLEGRLQRLARVGHTLWLDLFTLQTRASLVPRLSLPTKLAVARLAPGEIIPWSIIYDGPGTARSSYDKTCLKLLEVSSDQPLNYVACRDRGDCPLRDQKEAERTVCPWGFWGIKHQIEQPAQSLQSRRDTTGQERLGAIEADGPIGRNLVHTISYRSSPNMSMNVSMRLNFVELHEKEVRKLAPNVVVRGHKAFDEVLEQLRRPELHVIYFYCHGDVETRLGSPSPYLSLGPKNASQKLIPAELDQLDGTKPRYHWPEHPLVLINGCRTAALSPLLMADFVDRFAERGAAGVIGTEVKIWEQLAIHMAERFFELLLKGRPVGEVLLAVRHELLRRYNPLGLVYTAYCSADLRLVKVS